MQLAKLHQMLTSPQLKSLDEYLRKSPGDPVSELLLEALFVPQVNVESPHAHVLSPLECAMVAGFLAMIDVPAENTLQVLDFVSPEILQRLPLPQRIVILDSLLKNQCWERLAEYVDAADLPTDWFQAYAVRRRRYLQEQIEYAKNLLSQRISILPLVRRLRTLDPDNPRLRLLEGEAYMTENRHKKAQKIFMELVVDPKVGMQACKYLDDLHPELDFATTSEG